MLLDPPQNKSKLTLSEKLWTWNVLQAIYPAATKVLLPSPILPPPAAATALKTEEDIAEPRFLGGNSLDYEIVDDGGVIDTIAPPPPTGGSEFVIPPGRFKIYDALDPLAVPIE